MPQQHNLKNIRSLLNEGFSDEELRQLIFDVPIFRPVHNQLAQNTSKTQIVQLLLEYADKKELIENLLDQAKERNPTKYENCQPYYDITINTATPQDMYEIAFTHTTISNDVVLIIDDDEIWRETIIETLDLIGEYIYEEAMDLRTAREKLASQKFDIVTIDMEFEGQSEVLGETILMHIRRKYPNIVCIMISGWKKITFGKVDDLKDVSGLDAFIHKNEFSPEILKRAIERAKKAATQR